MEEVSPECMWASAQVKAFLQSLPPGALLADVGCGNGKYFGVRRDIAVLGSDRSPNLAETAARRSLLSLSFPIQLYVVELGLVTADARTVLLWDFWMNSC